MPVVPMTPERKAKVNEAFGAGLVIFGQKRPEPSTTASQAIPAPAKMTPEQVEQGMTSLRARVGYEMDKDDPMRSLASYAELSMARIAEQADLLDTEPPKKAP